MGSDTNMKGITAEFSLPERLTGQRAGIDVFIEVEIKPLERARRDGRNAGRHLCRLRLTNLPRRG